MIDDDSEGFSESLVRLARANSLGADAQPRAAAAAAPGAETAALPVQQTDGASLEEIAACAALLARMASTAMRAGPAQKISAGHVEQLCRRLETMLTSAGFTERDRLWDCLVRPGSASPKRFLG